MAVVFQMFSLNDPVFECVCVWTVSFELNDSGNLACWLTLSRSGLNGRVIGQSLTVTGLFPCQLYINDVLVMYFMDACYNVAFLAVCWFLFAFSALTLLVVWGEVQIFIWPSWCHCHSLTLASVNPDWFTFLLPAYPGSPRQRAF